MNLCPEANETVEWVNLYKGLLQQWPCSKSVRNHDYLGILYIFASANIYLCPSPTENLVFCWNESKNCRCDDPSLDCWNITMAIPKQTGVCMYVKEGSQDWEFVYKALSLASADKKKTLLNFTKQIGMRGMWERSCLCLLKRLWPLRVRSGKLTNSMARDFPWHATEKKTGAFLGTLSCKVHSVISQFHGF